jgi:tripartite-type tricarboxylate transporter receptor subunit TctC
MFGLRTKAIVAASMLAATALVPCAQAAYPDKPVKIIVGFSPGGSADAVARLLARAMSARLNQPFIVENKAGANGQLATDFVMRAAPDGYTLFYTSIGHAVNPSLYKEARYDPVKDFSPIGQVMSAPNVLVVPAKSPFNSLNDLLTYGRANQGKLDFASSGTGASVHLSAELFKQTAGIDMVHIPYKGTGSFMSDLLAGVVDLAFPNLPSAVPFIQAGKLKALGVTTAKRSASSPQIPTIAEAGLPGYEISTWYGLIGPAKMPPDVVEKLSQVLRSILQEPQFREQLISQGIDPAASSPQEFSSFIQEETVRWAALLKKIKLEPQ